MSNASGITLFCLVLLSYKASLTNSVNLDQLLQVMTFEEKCGQMTQVTGALLQTSTYPGNTSDNLFNETLLREAIVDKHIGSILSVPWYAPLPKTTWQKLINQVHDIDSKETRLKIPIIYGIDSIHGAAFIQEAILFPQQISQAATFNTEIARRIGEIASTETRAVGLPWNFSPVLDIGRQPLWPRYNHDFLTLKFQYVF
jgi:beta-glucosidase